MARLSPEELADLEARLLNCENEEEAIDLLATEAQGNPFDFVELALRVRTDLKRQVKAAMAEADKSRFQRVPIETEPDASADQTDGSSGES